MAKAWSSLSEREKLQRRLHSLKQERSPHTAVYQELSQQFAPASGRFFSEIPNRHVRDWSHIVDSSGVEDIETSAAGLMSIASPPSSPWIKYTTRDPDLDEFHSVQVWLADAARVTLDVYDNNNTYIVLPGYYRELLTFAISAGLLLPHFRKVVCHYPFTCGEYYLHQNAEGEVNTLAREYHMTAAQLHKRFGYGNLSTVVQQQWREGHLDMQHHIAHLIEPREDRDEGKADGRNMPWRSVYWEVGHDTEKLLDDTGFEDFPVLAPRWDTLGGDIYGTGPGHRALAHAKRLQILTKRIARGVHHQMDPATIWPTSMKNREIDTNPGGKTFGDFSQQQTARSLHESRPQLDHALLHLQDIRKQLSQAFFSDFFARVTNDQRNDRATAAEIHAIEREAWLMLGPFAQRVFTELLSPMTAITFKQLLNNGGFRPPPPELQGREISVRMTSPLAQAQEAVGAVADDRLVFQMGQIAAMGKPGVLHSFNEQRWAERYAQKIGADPKIIRPADEVQAIVAAEAQAQSAQAQAAMMEQQSKSVKNLGTTPSAAAGDTALSDVGASMAGAGAES